MDLTLKQYIQGVDKGDIDPHNIVQHYLEKAKNQNKDLNCYVRFHEDYIEENVEKLIVKKFKAAPIAIKDIILTKGYITSCGSKMMEDFVSPYSATCFLNAEKDGALMIGKANMDEYAQGSSGEKSAFGPTINPHGINRVPGGTSSGSAAAVAADLCIAALGTDTGGSIRQPASLCGIVGIKPTYGRVSRYGVQSAASSLDQVGVLTKNVEDAAILLKSISGFDNNDSTSVDIKDYNKWDEALNVTSLKNFKIALPKQYFDEGLDPGVKDLILASIEKIKALGAQVDWIDFPLLKYVLAVYYIINPAEISTNLSRFDGIRFGYQKDTMLYDSIYDYYAAIRSEAFGDEVKRRILIGTYVLSAGYYDAYYKRAQKVRKKIKIEFNKLYSDYDLILGPTSPVLPWKIGEHMDDPLKDYLADIYTVTVNLMGFPAMSLPIGFAQDRGEKLPVGLHIIADQWKEDKIFALASALEKVYN